MQISRLAFRILFGFSFCGFGAAGASGQSVDTEATAAACVPPGELARPMAELTESQRRALIACANATAARQLNSQMPMRVDDITILESVEAVGTTVVYNQRANVDARNVTPAIKASIDQSVRANVCGSEDMRSTISYGGAYTYVWIDRSGNFIHRLHITGC